jgi:serine protease AprX
VRLVAANEDLTRHAGKGWRTRRVVRVLAIVVAAVVVVSLGSTSDRAFAAAAPDPAATATYIVQTDNATALVLQLRLHHSLIRTQLTQGVVVDLTAADAQRLAQDPGTDVSLDTPVALSTLVGSPHEATTVFTAATGADALVASGIDGRGVTVAVLDTGIDPSPDFGDRLIGGVDLTGEGNPFEDDYGHGTFVAGLIAGDGMSSDGLYRGEAPGADLVAIKVAKGDGAVDTATVIRGIDWAVANQARFAIRVLNLSLGADATESTTTAPLDAAVERAWQAGIVVVASAGNYGPGNGSVSKPGDDPLIITTGAIDDAGTASPADDTVPAFSSVGPTWADGWFKPDVAVSGRSVVSLRAPQSTIDQTYPSAEVGRSYFKGSGTSFSAAIMSGAAALVLDAHPSDQPDEVKGRILATAAPGPVGNPFVDGHGSLDVLAATTAHGIRFNQDNAVHARSAGMRPVINSVIDLSSTWTASSWNPAAWAGSTWKGSSANQLGGARPSGSQSAGNHPRRDHHPRPGSWVTSWSGSSWSGSSWNGSSWNGSSWNGSSWSGSSWSGSSWNGSSWSGSSWNGSSWSGSSWNGSSWSGSSWSGIPWT